MGDAYHAHGKARARSVLDAWLLANLACVAALAGVAGYAFWKRTGFTGGALGAPALI